MELGRQAQDSASRERAQTDQLQRDRGQMPGYLVELVSSNSSMSQETITIIGSTLNAALEMDSGFASRNWRNENTRSNGTIEVAPIQSNQYGDQCREYKISLTDSDGTTRWTRGASCRQSGRWQVYPNTRLQPRSSSDGATVNNTTSDSGSIHFMTEGGYCSTGLDCVRELECKSNKCVKKSKDVVNNSTSSTKLKCSHDGNCYGAKCISGYCSFR